MCFDMAQFFLNQVQLNFVDMNKLEFFLNAKFKGQKLFNFTFNHLGN